MKDLQINNKEAFIINATAIICGYEELKNVWEAIRDTAKEMHGKVLNIRFWDTINGKIESKCGSVQVLNEYGNTFKSLYLHIKDNIFYSPYFCGAGYAEDFLSGKQVRNINDFATDGRIDSAKVETLANNRINTIKEEKQKFVDAFKNYDKYQKRRKAAVCALGDAFAKINPLFVPSTLNKYTWEEATKTDK